jgi:FkbM family methyltransferase
MAARPTAGRGPAPPPGGAAGTARAIVKRLYGAVPFKAPTFRALRRIVRLPPSVYRHLHFTGPVTIPVGSSHFKVHHYGYVVENDLFWAGYGKGWEATSLELWRRLAPHASTILDVGANTGIYALAAAALNPSARVIAFEPLPRVHQKLLANIRLNGFSIAAENVALSDKSGTAAIFDSLDQHVYSASLERGMAVHFPGFSEHPVQTMRADDYLRAHAIKDFDLAKIDVERHEAAVLRGFGGYLAACPTLLIEILVQEDAAAIIRLISSLKYRIYRIIEGVGVKEETTLAIAATGGGNFLLCRSETAERIGIADLLMS